MKLFAFTQAFLLFFIILIQDTLSLPTSLTNDAKDTSLNLALETRSQLERRDSWDCKGSGVCGIHINPESCLQALAKFNPAVTYRGQVRQFQDNGGARLGSCFVEYACEKKKDYISAAEYGVSTGQSIRERGKSIYSLGGCKKCGTVWFWGSCRVTFNYCYHKGC